MGSVSRYFLSFWWSVSLGELILTCNPNHGASLGHHFLPPLLLIPLSLFVSTSSQILMLNPNCILCFMLFDILALAGRAQTLPTDGWFTSLNSVQKPVLFPHLLVFIPVQGSWFTPSTTASQSLIFWPVSNIIFRFLTDCLWPFSFRSSLAVFCKYQWKVVENLGLPGPHFGVHRNRKWRFMHKLTYWRKKKVGVGPEGRERHFIISKHLYLFILIIFRYIYKQLLKGM